MRVISNIAFQIDNKTYELQLTDENVVVKDKEYIDVTLAKIELTDDIIEQLKNKS